MSKLAKSDKNADGTLTRDAFSELVTRLNAAKPDKQDIELWKKELEAKPDLLDISFLKSFQQLEREILDDAKNFLHGEIVKAELKNMRDSLGYAESGELERLLIKQVCFNWLRLSIMERIHFRKNNESHSIEAGLYWEKKLDGANKRFTRTAETLAKVKRLLAEADEKKATAKIKLLRAEEMERKSLPPGDDDFIDAETYEN